MHKKLPHIDSQEYYQFITFRTQDSIDAYVSKIQENSNMIDKIKQYKIDQYLDNSKKGAYLFGENITILKEILTIGEKMNMYEIDAFSIMPNHVHILIKQKDKLTKIMRFIKSKSAIKINKRLSKSGKFWSRSYFDKLIRDEKHYNQVYEYILNNHIRVGLKDGNERVYSKY